MKQTVQVLMSTYNGEKYLAEQIDSILNQEGIEVKLLIRDDGSKDGTINILNEYESKYDNITVYLGENLGAWKSFFDLLEKADKNIEYYALADQDDVWYSKKLSAACDMMNKSDVSEYKLYMTTYDIVDKDLNIIEKREMEYERKFTFPETIMGRCASGCTMVFNDRLREEIVKYKPEYTRMHDFWLLMSAELLGACIYTDSNSNMMYRQHESNVIGICYSKTEHIKRLLASALHGNNQRQREAIELYKAYKGRIKSEEDVKNLEKVVYYKDSLGKRLTLIFSKEFDAHSMVKNLLFKAAILLGVF